MTKLVSIITTTYNRANYLKEAIDSIRNQTYDNWELIIVDDNSIDNTRALVQACIKKDKRIKYLKNKTNLNVSRSRNRGLKQAEGDYVAILDSDDFWCDKNKLKKQVSFLELNKTYSLIGGGVIIVDSNGKELKRYLNLEKDVDIRNKILLKNQFCHSSVLYRKNIIDNLGGYSKNINLGEDYDLWLRIGEESKFANINEYFVKYRIHNANVSIKDRLRIMNKNLEIIEIYKSTYPNYKLAKLRRVSRLFLYKILLFIKQ